VTAKLGPDEEVSILVPVLRRKMGTTLRRTAHDILPKDKRVRSSYPTTVHGAGTGPGTQVYWHLTYASREGSHNETSVDPPICRIVGLVSGQSAQHKVF
jgi:hypothetical protein